VRFDADTREKIRVASALSEKTEQLEAVVHDLLEQPSARRANRVLGLVDALILWTPAAGIVICLVPAPFGGFLRGFMVLAIGVPLAIAGGYFARAEIVERQALRGLTMGMGARNPLRAGEPPRCRQCGGTLVIRPQHAVALCLYCHAENLLGLDLRPAAAAAQAHLYELGSIVSTRARQRGLARRRAALYGGLALLVLLAGLSGCASGAHTSLATLTSGAWLRSLGESDIGVAFLIALVGPAAALLRGIVVRMARARGRKLDSLRQCGYRDVATDNPDMLAALRTLAPFALENLLEGGDARDWPIIHAFAYPGPPAHYLVHIHRHTLAFGRRTLDLPTGVFICHRKERGYWYPSIGDEGATRFGLAEMPTTCLKPEFAAAFSVWTEGGRTVRIPDALQKALLSVQNHLGNREEGAGVNTRFTPDGWGTCTSNLFLNEGTLAMLSEVAMALGGL
jgi:hypothetical protein